MQSDTLLKCVRAPLRRAGLSAAEESPRVLRNTFGRRHFIGGKTNEQVSNLMGLSSRRIGSPHAANALWRALRPHTAEVV